MEAFSFLVVAALLSLSSAKAFPTISRTSVVTNKVARLHVSQSETLLLRNNVALSTLSAGVNPVQIRGGATAVATTTSTTAFAAFPAHAWVEAAGILAPVASVFVSMSPFTTIRSIVRNKSVGDLPLLPYSSLVANCFVWMTYGILKKEVKVWSCNSFSVLLGLYYFASFAKYSPKESTTLPGSISQHVQAAAGVILASLAVAGTMTRNKATAVLGKTGVCICIALFASPLAALKTVFETKSAESIPLPFAIAATLNCVLWSIVGVCDMKDINIWLPNILGLACGLLQIVLKLIYGNGKRGELVTGKQVT